MITVKIGDQVFARVLTPPDLVELALSRGGSGWVLFVDVGYSVVYWQSCGVVMCLWV